MRHAKPLEVRHPQSRRISSDSVVVEVKFQQSGQAQELLRNAPREPIMCKAQILKTLKFAKLRRDLPDKFVPAELQDLQRQRSAELRGNCT